MSALRWFLESWRTPPLTEIYEQQTAPIKIQITKDQDQLPEMADINGQMAVVINTGARNRLVEIEERQDKVRAAGEKRLANLELFEQMNRDVSFY